MLQDIVEKDDAIGMVIKIDIYIVITLVCLEYKGKNIYIPR